MVTPALQRMDLTALLAVLTDIRQELLPSRFEKVQQPEPSTIQLALRTLKGLVWLEMNWGAEAPRLVQIKAPQKKGGESTLAQQIQHGLRQMTLVAIKQQGFERVVEFSLARRPGAPVMRSLIIEIMGRHSNILLLDQDRRITTIGHQVREHQSRIRALGTGDLYTDPPSLKGIEPNQQESIESWKGRLCLLSTTFQNALQKTYQGISPSLVLQLAHDNQEKAREIANTNVDELSELNWQYLHLRWLKWLERIKDKDFYLSFKGSTKYNVWGWEVNRNTPSKGLSLALGEYYRDFLDSNKLQQLSNELQKRLISQTKLEEASLHKQEELLKGTSKCESFQREANKLLSTAFPNKSIIKEAQSLYRKAKKLRRSIKIIKERIDHHNQRLLAKHASQVFLEEILTNNWESVEEKLNRILELSEELNLFLDLPSQQVDQKNKRKHHTFKILELGSPSGLVIQIGRNHRQNEWISLRKSRNGDIWFHAQESPGSHVVLKASAGLAEEEDLKMAADLAAFFSRAKGNQRVPVVMAYTNNLRRIPGSIAGTVSHRESKVFWGEPSRGLKHATPSQ